MQTSSTAVRSTSPKRFVPFGAFVAYSVTYSQTAQKVIHLSLIHI